MTEDTGFTPVADEPEPEPEVQPSPEVPAEPAPEPAPEPETAAPLPDESADPQDVAEQAAAAEPDATPPALPDPEWLIDLRNQVTGALLSFAEDVHRRLRNLGG